jgi:molybdopterin-biosynthesis enzyme MoeA-like protein
MPAGATPIPNPEGLAPGCVAGSVYVLPGIPEEMKAVFGNVADDFGGDVVVRTLYSPEPEGALASPLGELTDRFAVRVGSYPNRSADRTRITVTGGGDAVVTEAVTWLRERTDVPLDPASTGSTDTAGPGVDEPDGDGSG